MKNEIIQHNLKLHENIVKGEIDDYQRRNEEGDI